LNNFYIRPIDISDALRSLYPTALWRVINDPTKFENIVWEDLTVDPPNQEVVEEEVLRLQAEQSATNYRLFRVEEYPPLADLADALYWQAHGDETKMTAYLAAVAAVKAKYPKE
jgi:hypothetical protein